MKQHAPRFLVAFLAILFFSNASSNNAKSTTANKPLTMTSSDFFCPYPAWSAAQVYSAGQKVKYGGFAWEARWWTQGDTPGVSDAWLNIGACPD